VLRWPRRYKSDLTPCLPGRQTSAVPPGIAEPQLGQQRRRMTLEPSPTGASAKDNQPDVAELQTQWQISPMISSVALYEALTNAPDDRARARVIAEAFERLEERYPHLPELATQGHIRESELRLQKEIEQVRAEVEQVRAGLRETELRLLKEIEQVRGEVARTKVDLIKWIVPLMFAQVAAIAALVKLL